MSDWFAKCFGASEPRAYESARAMFRVQRDNSEDATLISLSNSIRFHIGLFETPSVHELRSQCRLSNHIKAIRFQNVTGDVRALHSSQPDAVFQVASQFNALEMVSYNVTPEDGVTRYENDRTQGPACALCCPAATVYRNYLVNGMGQGGLGSQLDLLSDVAALVGNNQNQFWKMMNGYCMPCGSNSIAELSNRIESDSALAARLLDALRVGVHWSTQVGSGPHRVTQVFCSALPVSYTRTPPKDWRAFAIQVLKGAYQATLAVAAVLARRRNTRVSVYLTLLGGGAFGNPLEWIAAALDESIAVFASCPLDVYLVHYNNSAPAPFAALESKWK